MNKKALILYGFSLGAKLNFALRAIDIAHRMHEGQKRKDGVTDYVEHVINVAVWLLAMGINDDAIIAAIILHDIIEDTDFSYEDVEREFNKDIADLVLKVSKVGGISIVEYYGNIEEDIRAVVIKAVDRKNNLSEMVTSFSAKKMKGYVKETEKYILPIIKRARNTSMEYNRILFILSEDIKAILLYAKEVVQLREALKIE